MYIRNTFLMFVLAGVEIVPGQNNMLLQNLQLQYTRTIRSTNNATATIIAQSFEALLKCSENIEVEDFINSPCITKLFEDCLYKSVDHDVSDCVRSAQYIMLLQLYTMIFSQYIKTTESFLNDLISAKKYWFYEDFYLSQSLIRRHPVYSLYSFAYKDNVQRKVALLEELESQVAHMLGIYLYGIQRIIKIEREDQIIGSLVEAIIPLYDLYHVSCSNEEIESDPSKLFCDLLWMYGTMDQNMINVKTVLQENNKPSFVVEHWFGLSCAAATVFATYVVYKQQGTEIQHLKKKTVATVNHIWKDYINDPIHDLVDVLWYNQGKRIPNIKRIPRIDEQDWSITTFLADSTVNKIIRPYINNLATWLEDVMDTYTHHSNDLFMKNQQVNLALAAIGPIVALGFFSGKYSNAAYNRFIKHDNWYAPMKYSLRTADRLINSVARNNKHSFADDGKLYMLIMNVKQYISCLNNEELILMRADLDDLLSFNLTYEQKHGVIERMYHTYNFLK